MTIFRHLRPLSTIFWKNPRLIREGIQLFQPKINLAPITWYLGKTLATSRVSLKSDKSKSSDNQNENEIVENQEMGESENNFYSDKASKHTPHSISIAIHIQTRQPAHQILGNQPYFSYCTLGLLRE